MKISRLCAALSSLGILLAGCASWDHAPKDAPKVGAMLPLSGAYAHYGSELYEGMTLALDRFNRTRAEAGLASVHLTVRDTASNAVQTVELYNDFAKAGYPVVIGPAATEEALRLRRPSLEHKVPVILPVATGGMLTDRGDYLFRNCFSDDLQAPALADYLRHTLKIDRLAVMIDLGNEGVYGRSLGQKLSAAFKAAGGEVVRTEGFSNGDIYFSKQLNEMIARKPEAIFIPATAETAARLVREARLLGFTGWIVGGDSLAEATFLKRCDRDSGKILFTSQFSPRLDTPEAQEFRRAMRARTGRVPGDCEAQGYDTMMMVLEALTQDTPGDFLSHWKALEGYRMLTGPVVWDENDDAVRPVFFNEIEFAPDGTVQLKTSSSN